MRLHPDKLRTDDTDAQVRAAAALRRVLEARDRYGNEGIGQRAALRTARGPRPPPAAPTGHHGLCENVTFMDPGRGHTKIPATRWLYKDLLKSDQGQWSRYVEQRVVRRDDGERSSIRRGLGEVPKSLGQNARWFLFKLHLGGLMTTTRVAKARPDVQIAACPLCGIGEDSSGHLLQCNPVQLALLQAMRNQGGAALPDVADVLYFRQETPPEAWCRTLEVIAAAWTVRGAAQGLCQGRSSRWPDGPVPRWAMGPQVIPPADDVVRCILALMPVPR